MRLFCTGGGGRQSTKRVLQMLQAESEELRIDLPVLQIRGCAGLIDDKQDLLLISLPITVPELPNGSNGRR